jgi:WhiB family redox-sensing transcriptional regulator
VIGVPNCSGVEDDTMFPDVLVLTDPDAYADAVTFAKTICDGCPVKSKCLGGAIQRGEKFGVWGGTTPEERTALVAGRERLNAALEEAA